MEIGAGKFYNPRWKTQVCELDAYHNNAITQKINLRNLYTLSLEFAARDNSDLSEMKGEIYWNHEKIATFQPTDYNIKSISGKVYAREGDNLLYLRGVGARDAKGLGVDNVRLVKDGSTQNLVSNGDFENPKLNFDSQGFNGGIPSWVCEYMEMGIGKSLNKRWPTQIFKLDSYRSYTISQTIRIKDSGLVYSAV